MAIEPSKTQRGVANVPTAGTGASLSAGHVADRGEAIANIYHTEI